MTQHPDYNPDSWQQDSSPDSPDYRTENQIEEIDPPEETKTDKDDNKTEIAPPETSTIDPEDSSFSYASINRDIQQADRVLNEATKATWKQEMDDKFQHQITTSITLVKDEILETLSTTKGEFLTHLDTIRADMMEHATKLEARTLNAENVYQKLRQQQHVMEQLSQDIEQQQNSLQAYLHTFQQHTTTEQHEIQTTREEARTNFKRDIEQASRHYLVQYEKKSDSIMTHTRTK
jgi:hypothetical protein